MNSEIAKLSEFVLNTNAQWQQYISAIETLEKSKKNKIDLETQKSNKILQKQLSDIKTQLLELDNIKGILIAQNQSTQNLSKIRKSIESLRDVLSNNNSRDIEDISKEIGKNIGNEIDKYKTAEKEWVESQTIKFIEMQTEIQNYFRKYNHSILTNNIENISLVNLNFDGLMPITDSLNVSDKSYIFNLIGEDYKLSVPQLIPFLFKQNITLSYKKGYDIKSKIQELIIRLLLSAEAGNVKILFIDTLSNGENFKDFLFLNPDLYCSRIISQDMMIETKLSELEKHMTFISREKLIDYENIIDYNLANSRDSYPFYYILFDNYPNGISSSSAKVLDKLLRLGPKTGIHTFFFVNENYLNKDVYGLLEHTAQYIFDEHDVPMSKANRDKLCRSVKDLFELRYKPNKDLNFEEYILTQYEPWKADSTESLEIPIGLQLSKEVSLVYDNILKTHAHIVGKTGSGKSTLLHSIIMSACYIYSPDELELWLLDFKNGNEFQSYSRGNLPHAKVITLKNEKEVALHVLSLVEKEIDRRATIFKENAVSDYPRYRTKSLQNKLPRILVVIDEYQLLYNEDAIKFAAGKAITTILEKGRSYGISLLFASQTVHIPNDALGNISTRIALRTDLGRQLLESGSSKTLKLALGQGILNAANGSSENDIQFNWYYLSNTEHTKLIKSIEELAKSRNVSQKKWIFDGEAKAELQTVQLLHNKKPESIKELTFVPGEKLLIDDKDYIQSFIKLPNNNLLVVSGINVDPSIRSLYGTFVSMLPQLFSTNSSIYLMNFIKKNNKNQYDQIRLLYSFLMDNKFNVKYIEDDLETMNMLEEIIEGNNGNRDSEKPVTGCLVIFNTENSKEFEYDADYSDATQKLQEVLSNGTEAGFFTLLQFNSCEGYYKIFKDDDLIYFQHRIALQMTYEDSRNFVGNPRLASELHNPEIGDAAINRSCYYNSQLQLSAKLKPFEFVDRDCMNNMFNNIIK